MSVSLAVLAGFVALAPGAPGDHCAVGARTTLDVVVLERPTIPRHDESLGRERLELRAPNGKTLFSSETHDGRWLCLGFDRARGRYLVGGYEEEGTWPVLAGLVYLGEDGAPPRPSAFSREEYMAMASVTSPSGRYVAFVGGIGVIDGLYVLDTQSDAIRRLGKPPAPPPVAGDFTCDEPFHWGSCWVGAYVALEPEVLRFDGDDTLVVSRGDDTHRRRAARRTTQRVPLP